MGATSEQLSPVVQDDLCPLSNSLQAMVLQHPALNSHEATDLHWGALALANMVAILRDYGYEVIEPEEGCDQEGRPERAGKAPAITAKWANSGASSPGRVVDHDSLLRFQILTSIIDQNKQEDGRVNASIVEDALLQSDPHAFDKEGVEQLKQYLMKARECGVPIKFDGDHKGLHQVWFKGHRDLKTAISRYCNRDLETSQTHYEAVEDDHQVRHYSNWSDWRQRPEHAPAPYRLPTSHAPLIGYGFHNGAPTGTIRSSKYQAFEIEFLLEILQSCGAQVVQGADAMEVELKLLKVAPSLYEIKPGVKRFNHYLMNMRAAGAPIWFTRDDAGHPKEIFLKNTQSPSAYRRDTPTEWNNGQASRVPNTSTIRNVISNSPSEATSRYASLIEAYQHHYQDEAGSADAHLVQARLESKDASIYNREQCLNFKQLLKVARMNGLELTWEQRESSVSRLRIHCKE